MMKKILKAVLSISLIFTMMSINSVNVYAAGHPSHNGIDGWIEVTTNLPSSEGNYYLANDITLSGTWTVPTGTTNLCLNGHVINANGGSFRVITIPSGATLNLYDCNGSSSSHEGYVDSNSLWHLGTGAGTAKTITGGIITGGNRGGIIVSGTFNMYGGSIAGNNAANSGDHGGGIFINQYAQVNIMNGTIENNSCYAAGAGVHTDGEFKMTGGTIQNNKAGGDGAGLSINGGKGSATLLGTSKIINNIVTGQGGGISYYGSADKVTLGNKVQITGNTNTSGTTNNVYMFAANLYLKLGTGADAPASGMKVGVTAYTAPTGSAPSKFVSSATANDANFFFSDNTSYGVTFNTDHLELYNPQKAYNKTQHISYSTNLTDTITAAVSGDEIELWEDNNSEDITLPNGVILYTKSNYSGNVTTDIPGKVIAKQAVTGTFQVKYFVSDPPADNPPSNSWHEIPDTGVTKASTNNHYSFLNIYSLILKLIYNLNH